MDLFAGLKAFFKFTSTTIDNNVFRLHYKATAIVLIAFSILVTGRQYIGDPIDCLITATKDQFPPNFLDTFCWIHTTFSLPKAWHKTVGDEIPYPGIDKYTEDDERVYHAYYQWVCFVLFLQAILFYVPRYFWKSMEGGRIKSLILGLNSPTLPEDTRKSNRKLLVNYMVANLNNHNFFLNYLLAECMNFVNVVGQIFLMNRFLGGEFSSYGIKVIQFTAWDSSLRFDPMMQVFPRLTKCTFHNYGSTGDVEKRDALCILPINIINEKIYVFLWFWFIILAVMSGMVLFYRALIIVWPKSRFMVTRSRACLSNQSSLKIIVEKCSLGDWLLFDLLSKNLDSVNFRDFVTDLARQLDAKKIESA